MDQDNPLSGRSGVWRLAGVARGRVQGVGYRGYVAGRAAARGLAGYVQNLPDGTVEFVAEGEAKDLAAFLEEAWARDEPVIGVGEIAASVMEPTGEFSRFEARFGDRQEEFFRRSGFALDLMKEMLRTEQEILAEQRKTNVLLEAILRAGRR